MRIIGAPFGLFSRGGVGTITWQSGYCPARDAPAYRARAASAGGAEERLGECDRRQPATDARGPDEGVRVGRPVERDGALEQRDRRRLADDARPDPGLARARHHAASPSRRATSRAISAATTAGRAVRVDHGDTLGLAIPDRPVALPHALVELDREPLEGIVRAERAATGPRAAEALGDVEIQHQRELGQDAARSRGDSAGRCVSSGTPRP